MLQHDTSGNKIEQNILSSSDNGIFIVNYFTANTKNSLSSNIYDKEEEKEPLWVWKNEEYTSITDFQEATDSDSNSKYIDPDFVDAENGDFTLNADSPVKDMIE